MVLSKDNLVKNENLNALVKSLMKLALMLSCNPSLLNSMYSRSSRRLMHFIYSEASNFPYFLNVNKRGNQFLN